MNDLPPHKNCLDGTIIPLEERKLRHGMATFCLSFEVKATGYPIYRTRSHVLATLTKSSIYWRDATKSH